MNSGVSLKKFKQIKKFGSSINIAESCQDQQYQPKSADLLKFCNKYFLDQYEDNNQQSNQNKQVYQTSKNAFQHINNVIFESNYCQFPLASLISENQSDNIEGQSPHVQQKYRASHIIKNSPNEGQLDEKNNIQELCQHHIFLEALQKEKSIKKQDSNKTILNLPKNHIIYLKDQDSVRQHLEDENVFIPIRTRNKPETLFVQTYRKVKQRQLNKIIYKQKQQRQHIIRLKKDDSKHRRGYTYDYNGQLIPLRVYQGLGRFKQNSPTFTPLTQQQIINNYNTKPQKRNGRIMNKTIASEKQQLDLTQRISSQFLKGQVQPKKQQIRINQSHFNQFLITNKNIQNKQNLPFNAFKRLTSKYKQQKINQNQTKNVRSKFRLSQDNSPSKIQKRVQKTFKSEQKVVVNNTVFLKAFQVKINQKSQLNKDINKKIALNSQYKSLHQNNLLKDKEIFQKSFKNFNIVKSYKQQQDKFQNKPKYRVSCQSICSMDSNYQFKDFQIQNKAKSIRQVVKNEAKINIPSQFQGRMKIAKSSHKLKRQRK